MSHASRLITVLITVLLFTPMAQAGPLHDAAKKGDLATVKLLIKQGAKVNAVGKDEYDKEITPLHLAAYAGHTEVVNYLLNNGASINI